MEKFLAWLVDNSAVMTGAVFAFLISLITAKEGTIMDKIGNSLLCSLFSTGLYYAILSFYPNCSPYLAVAIGTFVGTFGVEDCKRIVKTKIDQWLKVDNEQKKD